MDPCIQIIKNKNVQANKIYTLQRSYCHDQMVPRVKACLDTFQVTASHKAKCKWCTNAKVYYRTALQCFPPPAAILYEIISERLSKVRIPVSLENLLQLILHCSLALFQHRVCLIHHKPNSSCLGKIIFRPIGSSCKRNRITIEIRD